MKKFHNTYRIDTTRLPGWDYRNAGAYFITICTQDREHFFGECVQGKVKLSTAGMIDQGCWFQIPYLSANAHLDAFVVMPNHIHGILILDEMGNDGDGDNGNGIDDNGIETFETNASSPLSNANPDFNHNHKTNSVDISINNENKNVFYQNISPKLGSVSRIIQQYKTTCTKHIRLACPEMNFKWQSRFYDHIIRNQQAFQNISSYITNNPKQWGDDKFRKSST